MVLALCVVLGVIPLPCPDTIGTMTVEQALHQRRSVRSYKNDSLSLEEVGQLLWAAQGKTASWGGRTAPSAGATYPMELYLIVGRVKGLGNGVYHYLVNGHALELLKQKDVLHELSGAAWGQTVIESAPVSLVLVCDYGRTTGRYSERGRRYVHMEAGHISENVYLCCEDLGMGTVAIGAFSDRQVKLILGIRYNPLYIMPVGHKKERE
ncbi:hypothetical protein CH330_06925 [candidate division WOR-3 bacterium JGI_Cruoil_03_51_56]|uniref:Nitroreductase domain-containing protein n=1 Tax=candidate division WOR-3 bacterium JGI_Cruoil_03_51_56 TaxID=1973747 RepID=A0A235BTX4_UNCW3|nr:MAG: hypothetical protein CH330_06925 [candidate division WOR-3 bacterium JGI_Cruoil_03_51_56]